MNEKHEPSKMSDEGKDETLFNLFLQETNFSGGPRFLLESQQTSCDEGGLLVSEDPF